MSLFKQVTTLPCPWDVELYGGERQYITVFDALKNSFPAAHCYPSGHASGGYALLSCFFAANQYRRANGQREVRSAYYWLLPGMTLGVVFGITQQLRGAHFISHDLMSFSMCYAVCWLMQISFFKR